MDVMGGIVKKCYVMTEPKQFFDELLSPFNFMRLLSLTFGGGHMTKQGSDFL